ncbi:MAG TPA: hypothetical protein VGK61_06395, partial [Planctomycetota bacterium]
MKWTTPILLALLSACASRKPLEEPTIKSVPAALIADSGASLYVIATPRGWFDDEVLMAGTRSRPEIHQ